MQDGTGAGLLAFLDRIGSHGEINPATARALRAAAKSVLAIEADPDGVDVRGIDVDNVLDRFENLNRARMKDDSMATYRSRFRIAVAMYIAWLAKEPNWKSAGKRRPAKSASNGGRHTSVRSRRSGRTEPVAETGVTKTVPSEEPAPRMVVYDMPLRRDLLVRITLPVDLTTADADRVAAFVRSLAFDRPGPSSDGAGTTATEGG